jgi:glutathione S-transferase
MIKVISFTICPFVQRVTALLEAKSIAYEIAFINLSNKPEWFLKLSPNAQVPVLITESGIALFESDAIVEYLEEAYTPLLLNISPEQKALDRAWSYLATKHYLVQCSTMRSEDQKTFEERAAHLDQAFSRIEKAVDNKPFFKGEALSNIDIAWLPLLHRAAIIQQYSYYDFFGKYPKVKAWQTALLKSGLVKKSVSQDFEDKFVQFYLSNKTYLGSKALHCKENDCSTLCEDHQCCA